MPAANFFRSTDSQKEKEKTKKTQPSWYLGKPKQHANKQKKKTKLRRSSEGNNFKKEPGIHPEKQKNKTTDTSMVVTKQDITSKSSRPWNQPCT